MKILIYIIVFFIYSVLKPFFDDAIYKSFSSSASCSPDQVAMYCGLCAALFAVSAFLCARWLCKVWDNHKAAKAHSEVPTGVSEAELPSASKPELIVTESPAEPPAPIESPAPTPKLPKARFCKLCGGSIDPVTRKCTECKKQYFRPPVFRKKHFFIAGAAVACIVVVLLVSSLVSQLSAANAQIAELNSQVSELENTVAEQQRKINVYKSNESSYRGQLASKDDTIENLREKNTTMGYKIDFFNEHVVFIPDDGSNTYHIYGCQYLNLLSYSFYAYNTENAKYQGYKPCPYCCE